MDRTCTSLCGAIKGGVSCSKLVLVDVVNKEDLNSIYRVYAIVDEQSNSSLISSKLADKLGAVGPEEKYYLTTCGSEKEAKYGRRVTGVILKSLSGAKSELPILLLSVIISFAINGRFQHRRWLRDSLTFGTSQTKSHPLIETLKFTSLSDETPRSC